MIDLFVAQIRYEKGYTLKELSGRSGVSKSQICDIENGFKIPTITTLCAIARGLRVPCYDLLECNCGNPERKCKYNGYLKNKEASQCYSNV